MGVQSANRGLSAGQINDKLGQSATKSNKSFFNKWPDFLLNGKKRTGYPVTISTKPD